MKHRSHQMLKKLQERPSDSDAGGDVMMQSFENILVIFKTEMCNHHAAQPWGQALVPGSCKPPPENNTEEKVQSQCCLLAA